MAVIDDFFEFDEATNTVNLKPMVKTIPLLRTIVERDKGTPGDRGGRKKEFAKKEIAFIGFFLKKTYLAGRSRKDRIETIKKRLQMPEDWEPDATILQAINELEEDIKLPEYKAIEVIEKVLLGSLSVFEAWAEKNQELVDILNTLVASPDDDELIKQRRGLIKELRADHKALLDLVTAFPRYVKDIQSLRITIDTERVEQRKAVGNKGGSALEKQDDLYKQTTVLSDEGSDEDFIKD